MIGQPGTKIPRKDNDKFSDVASIAHTKDSFSSSLVSASAAVSDHDYVKEYTTSLLPSHFAESTFESKLVNKVVMLDNPSSGARRKAEIANGAPSATGRNPKKSGTSTQPLSRSQRSALGMSRMIKADGCTLQDFLPLNRLWNECVYTIVPVTVYTVFLRMKWFCFQ